MDLVLFLSLLRMMNVCDILFLTETRCERSELSTHTHTHKK